MAQYSLWGSPKPATPQFITKVMKNGGSHVLTSNDFEDSPSFMNKPLYSAWNANGTSKNQDTKILNYNKNAFDLKKDSDMSPTAQQMIPPNDSTQNFLARYSQLKDLDSYRNELVEELACRYEYLAEQHAQLSADIERECEYNRTTQRREKTYQENIRSLQVLLDRDPFILVLLDGNTITFRDDLFQMGEAGGIEAAAMLHDAVLRQISNTLPDVPPEIKVLVRIYTDLKRLGDTLYSTGVIDHSSRVDEFAKGFNSGPHSLFDLVDVGNGKDRADVKISDTMKLHLFDFHCRQLFVGCSFNHNYTQIMKQVAKDPQTLNRITLVKGAHLETDLASLPFDKIQFDGLFKTPGADLSRHSSTQSGLQGSLGDVKPFSGQPPSVSRQLSQMSLKDVKEFTPAKGVPLARAASISTTDSAKVSPSVVWATIAAKPAPAPIATPVAQVAISTTPRNPQVPRNRKGQRVDPLIKHDKIEVDRVKKLKMCNVHYLRHECPYGDSCTHSHTYKPTAGELQTLRLVARMAPCMNGSDCDDVKCIYGHTCPAPEGRDGKDCIFADACRFPPELHRVDRAVVKTTKV